MNVDPLQRDLLALAGRILSRIHKYELFVLMMLALGVASPARDDADLREIRSIAEEASIHGTPMIEHYQTIHAYAIDKNPPKYRRSTWADCGSPRRYVDAADRREGRSIALPGISRQSSRHPGNGMTKCVESIRFHSFRC